VPKNLHADDIPEIIEKIKQVVVEGKIPKIPSYV